MMKCPFCNSDSERVHVGTRDNKDIDIYSCEKCEVKFLSKLDSDIAYEDGEMYENNILNKVSIEARIKEYESDTTRRINLTKLLCEGKNVLDFGCGFGAYLQEIQKISQSVAGVELGKQERAYCCKNGLNVSSDIDTFEEKFDVITLFHVFEHLKDPKYWLKKFYEHQNKGGVLILEVPHAKDALIDLYRCKAFEDFTYWSAHIYLYTEKSLKRLVEDSDMYEILEAKQVQRYTLANHLMWLANGRPGGGKTWNFIDDKDLNYAYEKKLKELGLCDTLFYVLVRK